jgi:hypothetical protein
MAKRSLRSYNVESYLARCVFKYCDLAKEHVGKDVQMKRADAPFLLGDQATSPQRRPLFDGSYETCSFCKRAYSKLDPLHIEAQTPPSRRAGEASSSAQEVRGSTSLVPVAPVPGCKNTAKKKNPVVPTDDSSNKGRLQPIAASILMMILYVARLARYDLLRAVCRLCCRVSKRDDACDRKKAM